MRQRNETAKWNAAAEKTEPGGAGSAQTRRTIDTAGKSCRDQRGWLLKGAGNRSRYAQHRSGSKGHRVTQAGALGARGRKDRALGLVRATRSAVLHPRPYHRDEQPRRRTPASSAAAGGAVLARARQGAGGETREHQDDYLHCDHAPQANTPPGCVVKYTTGGDAVNASPADRRPSPAAKRFPRSRADAATGTPPLPPTLGTAPAWAGSPSRDPWGSQDRSSSG